MSEAFTVTLIYWCTFVISAGAFWVATMEAAPHMSFKSLYKNYVIYLAVGWFPIVVTVSVIVTLLGALDQRIFTALHFVGALVIFYMAYKIVSAKLSAGSASFNFDWKAMTLVSWTNPKVWLLIPTGFITATFTDSAVINMLMFYFIGVPLFLFGVFFWGTIGKLGAKISMTYISYFNAALLIGFGVYLLYAGYRLLMV